MALGLHFLLLAGIYWSYEVAINYLELYDFISNKHVNPMLLIYLISFAISGSLFLAFDKISVWLWVAAGILSPIFVMISIVLVLSVMMGPLPP